MWGMPEDHSISMISSNITVRKPRLDFGPLKHQSEGHEHRHTTV